MMKQYLTGLITGILITVSATMFLGARTVNVKKRKGLETGQGIGDLPATDQALFLGLRLALKPIYLFFPYLYYCSTH
jgi:hypothetical protein